MMVEAAWQTGSQTGGGAVRYGDGPRRYLPHFDGPIHRIPGSFLPHVLLISSDPIAGRASMSHNEVVAAFLVGGSIAWFLGLAIRGWFNAHYEIRKRK
jgi:hypothetical protein